MVNLYNPQIKFLPRKTKIYATYLGPWPPFRTARPGLLVPVPLPRLIGTECEVNVSNSDWELFISNESRVTLLSVSLLTQRTEAEAGKC